MKCTNKPLISFLLTGILIGTAVCLPGCGPKSNQLPVTGFEKEHFDKYIASGEFFSKDIAVVTDDITNPKITEDRTLHASGLFLADYPEPLFTYHIHDKLAPASTTKILTALLALENGNLADMVTVSENAITSLEEGSSVSGLMPGDQLTLKDLLYGLLLQSGNDSAMAISEHIGGSTEHFVEMMNQRAKELGATNTHFSNPHGLDSEDHYTTAYDLYLMFHACIKNPDFLSIIESVSYNTSITGKDKVMRSVTFTPTSHYITGEATAPEQITLIGGKTGTTTDAGSCLILLSKSPEDKRYISIVMGGTDYNVLYSNMNLLLQAEL